MAVAHEHERELRVEARQEALARAVDEGMPLVELQQFQALMRGDMVDGAWR